MEEEASHIFPSSSSSAMFPPSSSSSGRPAPSAPVAIDRPAKGKGVAFAGTSASSPPAAFPTLAPLVTPSTSPSYAGPPSSASYSFSGQFQRHRGASNATDLTPATDNQEDIFKFGTAPASTQGILQSMPMNSSPSKPHANRSWATPPISPMAYSGRGARPQPTQQEWAMDTDMGLGLYEEPYDGPFQPRGNSAAGSFGAATRGQLVANADPVELDLSQFDGTLDVPESHEAHSPQLQDSGHSHEPFSPMGLGPTVNMFEVLSNNSQQHLGTSVPFMARWNQPLLQGPNIIPSTYEDGRQPALDVRSVASAPSATQTTRGRQRGMRLTEPSRKKAHAMRRLKACGYCNQGHRNCSLHTPCRACVNHFGPQLLEEEHFCRYDIVEACVNLIVVNDPPPHPSPRMLADFFGRGKYEVTRYSTHIPVYFGFGPPLICAVSLVYVPDSSLLSHKHVHYSDVSGRPAVVTRPSCSVDYVLPVRFQEDYNLIASLNAHLEYLVNNHFRSFNAYSSHAEILHGVYNLVYQHARQTGNEEYAEVLLQALKLLVLFHSTDITVNPEDKAVQNILASNFAPGYQGCRAFPSSNYPHPSHSRVTPCLLRGELGQPLADLAKVLLRDVLKRILRITLTHQCQHHAVVLAVYCVIMMCFESITYRSVRIGFHASTVLPHAPAATSVTTAGNRLSASFPPPQDLSSSTAQSGGRNSLRPPPALSIRTTKRRSRAVSDTLQPPASLPTSPVSSFSPSSPASNPSPTSPAALMALERLNTAASHLLTCYILCYENCHKRHLMTPLDDRALRRLSNDYGNGPAQFLALVNRIISQRFADGSSRPRATTIATVLSNGDTPGALAGSLPVDWNAFSRNALLQGIHTTDANRHPQLTRSTSDATTQATFTAFADTSAQGSFEGHDVDLSYCFDVLLARLFILEPLEQR